MKTDSGERRLIKPFDLTPEQQQEPLPCPRCDSPNTKFCYFNNYNLAQPRHFCKSCRRYWTQGGALRNIPVGGGTRKNSTKRSRTTSSTTITSTPTPTPTATTSSSSTSPQQEPIPANPISFHPANITSLSLPMFAHGYTSLLNTTQVVPGFLGMNGFGLGLGGAGFDEMGVWNLGLGLGDVGESTSAVNLGGGGGGNGGNMWQQLGIGGDGGFGDSECSASWPELAISTPRKGVK